MPVNESIFKAYDIRGLYPEEINEQSAYAIGRASARFLSARSVAVGRDMRNSSPSLKKSLIKGLTAEGTHVIDLDLASTPMVYFASSRLAVDAAMMVTASHNPAAYNGFKICRKNAVPVGAGTGLEEIKSLAVNGQWPDEKKAGQISSDNRIQDDYFNFIAKFFQALAGQKKKIVIDYGNAMGIFEQPIFDRLADGIKVIPLYDTYDGSFPNHEPNPLKTETLAALQKKVRAEKADLGFSYDGDADRIGFVDEQGAIVPMDFISGLLAGEVLKNHPGGLVLIDLRSSKAVREFIQAQGGRVELCRVGHSLIKKQMREQGAIFAGELSGHYYFQENQNAEMSTLAALLILNLLNRTGQPLSVHCQALKKYFHSGEINSEVMDKEAIMQRLKKKYADGQISELDGVRIDFPDWWFNVRPSNTEPALRLNLEGKTEEIKREKLAEVLALIRGGETI
ncbi:phosphomannomutase/phosphoglucomutase [Candidatus Falkowbacteria bacterium CG_4_10_14_0_2_um_filter_48_10]|uniref:Phosphomannomutase/phosphoglucomutase n=1 Tax=Candidatus Falkowbacteria bacterium CG23_combo_of_CG06-09_8_20_14_all_49_15 TaxID=1974572 RepID=A0A2G9ZJJ8_9BACT|nr:MAG: phosphomannomutase/phosphoglucomutase [Candidatus Falkowbacteria bacterium CG23_combo_of_CG06-09_8_20_14_all_49_15]PJA08362.1 MAG: phosphomannomutase/phosphoglucomutase [Candidatus Falkowbacteria bacterium CG_4_10_14_0_2_um_filter_48_10]